MKVFVPPIERPLNVRGTVIRPDETPEQYLQKLARITLDEMFQLVGVLTTDGILLECNRAALVAGGLTREEVIGKPFWETFWWTVTPQTQSDLRQAITRSANGEFVRYDVEVYGRKSGTETMIMDFTLLPVRDEGGRVVFLLPEGRDITEKKAREREIARQREELAQLDALKTQFFANVSHEFRTPLTLMLGPTEDLLRGAHGELLPAQRAELELIRRNQLRLQRLVNALLDFSRIEAGRANAVYREVDLARLTRDIASSFQSAIEHAGLRFEVECPELRERVCVDTNMWEQIVLNLLSNAFKFTFEGRIRVALSGLGSAVQLSVSDTGVGVAAEQLPKLFERFHRVEGTRARTHEGSGIGLALVAELVRLHGGSVRVESVLGAGTTFSVTLPAGAAHLPAERIAARSLQLPAASSAGLFVEEALRWLPEPSDLDVERSAAAARRATSPGGSVRILVADDNADMRAYLRRILESRWSVETVSDGVQAIEAARRLRPQLVLTDVMMPVLDGFGLVRALRADPDLAGIPVIMLSARAGEEANVDGLTAGADDYLVKPFSARELCARVAATLETSELRRTLEAERRRLLMLFENAPALICQLRGPDHVFEIANPHFRRFTGNRKLIGLSAREAFPEIEGQGYFELLDHVYRTGQPHLANESPAMVDLDGDGRLQEQFVSYIFYPSRSASGSVDGVLVLGVDVTEHITARRRAEEERRIAEAARAKAESAVRVRDEFLSVASHELRTPLTTLGLQVDGLLQALCRGGADRESARWVQKAERVRDQADRLEQLVEGMIDVFSLGRERVELVCEDVDLAELTRGVIERIRPEAKRARAPIELTARPVVGHWDPKRLEQIVFQLLSNALKFGAGGSVQVNVTGNAEAATLSIVDHGIGIAPEHHERIFGRFERASPATNYGGFGLGLWVVRELVSAMRGHVRVDSEAGRGSTFSVELPRRP